MRLLDLFCGQGGAAAGYARAGFEVTGVDINPQPRFPYTFVQADAVEYVKEFGHLFDAIHASPPCQAHSALRTLWKDRAHPELVAPTREALVASGKPWIIENVPGAPLIDPVVLCGSMFDLKVADRTGLVRWLRRHRLFESNVALTAPGPCAHGGRPVMGVYGHSGGRQMTRGYKATRAEASAVLGIDWMSLRGLSQSVPPAYAEWLGRIMLDKLTVGE